MTLRVLHVVASAIGRGAETFAADLVHEIEGADVCQRVLVLRFEQDPRPRFDAETRYVTAPGVRLPLIGLRTGVVSTLRHAVESWKPDVIQAHGGEPLKYLVLSGLAGWAPVVYRRIGTAPRWVMSGTRRWSQTQLMHRAARIVAVAECVRREAIQRFGVPLSRIVVIPNAVRSDRVQAQTPRAEVRRALRIPAAARCVISIGALTWEKDPLGQLAATAPLLRSRADMHHVFVGDGPLRPRLEAARAALTERSRVHVLGHRTQTGDLLAASDCVLFGSRADGMEGMPASLIEAGLAGLPVVGYGVAGAPEVIVHGATGLLVSPGDQDGLAEALDALLGDSERRERLGAAARKRCQAGFDIGVVAGRYLQVYREVAMNRIDGVRAGPR